MTMRRRRAWADTRFAGTTIAASGTDKKDLLTGLAAMDVKIVTRLIGDVRVYGGATTETEYEMAIGLGIGVVSKEAYDLETLPDTDNVADYPQQGWIYVATQVCYQAIDSAGSGLHRVDARFIFDIRAQRKVDRGVLFMLIDNTGIGTSSTLSITGRVRALCLT